MNSSYAEWFSGQSRWYRKKTLDRMYKPSCQICDNEFDLYVDDSDNKDASIGLFCVDCYEKEKKRKEKFR